MTNINKIIGAKGGNDGCFFEILAEEGRGKTKYYPSIKNGKELHWDHPEYWNHKIEVERDTIRVIVAGNPICAEGFVRDHLGVDCMTTGPGHLDIYPKGEV